MPWSKRLVAALPWANCLLVVAAWAVGEAGDEGYFRHVGHMPDTYRYFEWAAMAFNGPAALVAGISARGVAAVIHSHYLEWYLECGLWAALSVLQWRAYLWLARRARGDRHWRFGLRLGGTTLLLVGLAWLVRSLLRSPCSGGFDAFCDPTFWPARAGALACTGAIIVLLAAQPAVAADNPAAGASV